jgi:FHS family L-fucose permease-like MFS transporter
MIASALCLTVLFGRGPLIGYAALAIGFFNSIMFPTIFTLTLERSGVSQSATSGLLSAAILGGAALPLAVGAIADRFGLSAAFGIPLIGYVFIGIFALAAREVRGKGAILPVQEPPFP